MSELKDIALHFSGFVLKKLGISVPNSIELSKDRDSFETYAYYNPKDESIHVYVKGRSTADVLRSIAHEIVHHKQRIKGELTADKDIPDVGGPIEDEANAVAGQLIKEYGKLYKDKYNIYT